MICGPKFVGSSGSSSPCLGLNNMYNNGLLSSGFMFSATILHTCGVQVRYHTGVFKNQSYRPQITTDLGLKTCRRWSPQCMETATCCGISQNTLPPSVLVETSAVNGGAARALAGGPTLATQILGARVYKIHGCFCKLGVEFLGVLIVREPYYFGGLY